MCLVHLATVVAQQTAATPVRAGAGLVLLLAMAALLLILLVCLVLIVIARRLRRAQERADRAPRPASPDPWKSAGRRMDTPPSES